MLGKYAKVETKKIEYAFAARGGWLACPVPNQWCFSVKSMLIRNGLFEPDWFVFRLFTKLGIGWHKSSTSFVLAKREWMWTTCRWLSLLQLVTLGNPPRLGEQTCFVRWSQVVLSEDHDSCFVKQTRSNESEGCEIGEQGSFDLRSENH
jgi:hypothetical protein